MGRKNSKTRFVLKKLEEHPKSAKEISEECNISISTTHRIIKKLLEKNLLKKSGMIDDRGVKIKLYQRMNSISPENLNKK